MAELLRTNDVALLSAVEGLLLDEGIDYHVADAAISVLEGSIGAFPRRLLVHDDELGAARELLDEAGLGHWLPPPAAPPPVPEVPPARGWAARLRRR